MVVTETAHEYPQAQAAMRQPGWLRGHASVLALLVLSSACGGSACGGASPGGGASPDDTSGTVPPAGGELCQLDGERMTGEGTYYDADGSGNCSFPPSPGDLMVAAMNDEDYDGSAACGACVAIDGPEGSVVVRIVDRCPGCPKGDVDMSPQAFEQIAPLEAGRVPIRWRYVACEPAGPIAYHFKDGSNPWWTAVQIRNHRYPIASFEYLTSDGTYRPVTRQTYNYFVASEGMGDGPYTFRVTDVLGQVVEDSGIPFQADGQVNGAQQLPACMGE